MARDNDIKAPDGFLLGGIRRVRKDGTILFQRGYWELPEADKDRFIGEDVWCHILDRNGPGQRDKKDALEVADPGYHIYEARTRKRTVIAERNEKPDAKPGFRSQHLKLWHARVTSPEACEKCGGETHPDEAACIHCGATKSWANEDRN
jgi:hypothetical protein